MALRLGVFARDSRGFTQRAQWFCKERGVFNEWLCDLASLREIEGVSRKGRNGFEKCAAFLMNGFATLEEN